MGRQEDINPYSYLQICTVVTNGYYCMSVRSGYLKTTDKLGFFSFIKIIRYLNACRFATSFIHLRLAQPSRLHYTDEWRKSRTAEKCNQ